MLFSRNKYASLLREAKARATALSMWFLYTQFFFFFAQLHIKLILDFSSAQPNDLRNQLKT